MSRRFTRLDRAAIKRLEPGDNLTEQGITAQCMPNRDIRYSVNVMVDGRRIHKAIGFASDGVTLTQCQEFIERAKSDARAGRLDLPKSRKLALKLAAAAPRYLARLAESGGKNLKIKKRHLKRGGYIDDFFGNMGLDQISTFTIDRYKKQRLDRGAAKATVNRELATLSHLFGMAVEWRWINRRPGKIVKYDEGPGRIIALDDEQSDRLLSAALCSSTPLCWLFAVYALNTTMRHQEIIASRFDEIDFARRRQHIPDAKAGKREQPLTIELVQVLERERAMRDDRAGWIFPSPHSDSARGHRANMGRPIKDAVVRAGLNPKDVTPHVLRHTAITNLVQCGTDVATIQKISGHKTLAMVMKYVHVHGKHIDAGIAALGRPLQHGA